MTILTQWVRELRYDLANRERQLDRLEHRCHRLELSVRRQALARRHWIRNGHGERV